MSHNINTVDIHTVEMTLDIMKYVLNRVSTHTDTIGSPKSYEDLKAIAGDTITEKGIGGEVAFNLFKDELVTATIAEDHPRNLSFVPASPSKASVLFDLVTSASSIHAAYWMVGAGAIFCEMEAMDWLVDLTGFPKETAFGVFTSGGTSANLSALVTARDVWRKKTNNNNRGMILTSYGAHSSVKQMAKVMDVDVHFVNNDENDQLIGARLKTAIEELSEFDKNRLFAVVATSGTTNAGVIDDLESVSAVCQEYDLWLHVDGAYGGAALAVPSVRAQFKGIENANSFTIDPHKWLFTTYDCGALIYRDIEQAKEAHAQKGSYLEIFNVEGAQGFNPSDYQIQLTRRARGVQLWFSLAMHGTKMYTESIEKSITLAKESRRLIDASTKFEMVRNESLSVVLFRVKGWQKHQYQNCTVQMYEEGLALVTPTYWTSNEGESEMVYRFCFINPDTSVENIKSILDFISNWA